MRITYKEITEILEERGYGKYIGKMVFLSVFGSQLYGTSTPESDVDIKGVFVPNLRDLILQRTKKVISFKVDHPDKSKRKDIEIFSLHEFINLSCQGQTIALDMLHTTPEWTLFKTGTWDDIVKDKDKFLQKRLSAFMGYAKAQATKYGVKGTRLNEVKEVVAFLSSVPPVSRLHEHWEKLPVGEHTEKLGKNEKSGWREYYCCGRKTQETVTVDYALNIFKKLMDEYGSRANRAANMQGSDWKALSHALRICSQLKQVYLTKEIKFPLENAEFLLEVKQGKHDYASKVSPLIENMLDEVNGLADECGYPEKVDRSFWDDFIYSVYLTFILSKTLKTD